MKNKILGIILIFIILIFMIANVNYAAIDFNPSNWEPNSTTEVTGADRLLDFGNIIIGILRTVGTIISVAVLAILGIKYMLGSVEEKATYKEVSFDHSILLKPTWDTELAYLAQAFLDDAKESGLTLEATPTTVKIPKSAVATVTNYKETVTFILERFGYSLFKKPAPKKARPAKARHKWTKEVSQIPFYIDY